MDKCIELFTALYSDCEGKIELRALPQQSRTFIEIEQWGDIKTWVDSQDQQNIYYGVATRDGIAGEKDNIVSIPAWWVDLDWKDTPRDKADELVRALLLPPSAAILSGGGYQLLWFSREPLGSDCIGLVEDINQRLSYALGGDSSCYDVTRILRVPGTMNYKPVYIPPRPVELLFIRPGVRYNPSDFDKLPSIETHEAIVRDSGIEKIMECRFMRHCRDDAATLSEPHWYCMLNVLARIKGGPKMIHALSRPYPKYSKDETTKKILHAVNDSGPPTCEYIKFGLRFDCKSQCDVRSPVGLRFLLDDNEENRYNVDMKDIEDNKDNEDSDEFRGHYEDNLRTIRGQYEDNLTRKVRAIVDETHGEFDSRYIDYECHLRTRLEKKNRSQVLLRLVEEGIITRSGNRGAFRKIENKLKEIDFLNAGDKDFDINLPFGLNSFVSIHPGNILIIAGVKDAGKSAMMFHLLQLNNDSSYPLLYFSSEMGGTELKSRLSSVKKLDGEGHRIPFPLSEWRFKAYERSRDFEDVIDPNGINFIDYLEVLDEFWKVGRILSDLHARLDSGIAIIALQKKRGYRYGRGAEFSAEKARLYLTLETNKDNEMEKIITIESLKNKKVPYGMAGKSCRFKLTDGCIPEPLTGWEYM